MSFLQVGPLSAPPHLHTFAAFTVARVLSIWRNDKNRFSLTNIPVTSRPEVVIIYADLYEPLKIPLSHLIILVG